MNPTQTQIIALNTPLKAGEKQYLEITLRPPMLKDIRSIQRGSGTELDATIALVARLTDGEVPEQALEQITNPKDWQAITEAVNTFLTPWNPSKD